MSLAPAVNLSGIVIEPAGDEVDLQLGEGESLHLGERESLHLMLPRSVPQTPMSPVSVWNGHMITPTPTPGKVSGRNFAFIHDRHGDAHGDAPLRSLSPGPHLEGLSERPLREGRSIVQRHYWEAGFWTGVYYCIVFIFLPSAQKTIIQEIYKKVKEAATENRRLDYETLAKEILGADSDEYNEKDIVKLFETYSDMVAHALGGKDDADELLLYLYANQDDLFNSNNVFLPLCMRCFVSETHVKQLAGELLPTPLSVRHVIAGHIPRTYRGCVMEALEIAKTSKLYPVMKDLITKEKATCALVSFIVDGMKNEQTRMLAVIPAADRVEIAEEVQKLHKNFDVLKDLYALHSEENRHVLDVVLRDFPTIQGREIPQLVKFARDNLPACVNLVNLDFHKAQAILGDERFHKLLAAIEAAKVASIEEVVVIAKIIVHFQELAPSLSTDDAIRAFFAELHSESGRQLASACAHGIDLIDAFLGTQKSSRLMKETVCWTMAAACAELQLAAEQIWTGEQLTKMNQFLQGRFGPDAIIKVLRACKQVLNELCGEANVIALLRYLEGENGYAISD